MGDDNASGDGQQSPPPPTFDPAILDQKVAEAMEAFTKNQELKQTQSASGNDQQQATQQTTATAPDYQALQDSINALPEKLVNAFRETFQKPSNSSDSEKEKEKESTSTQEPGRRRSFRELWFGSEAV